MSAESTPGKRGRRVPNGVSGARKNTIKIVLSDFEEAKVSALAEARGVTRQRLLLSSALAGSAEAAAAQQVLWDELRPVAAMQGRLCSLVNQIAAAANSGADLPPEFAQVCRAVEKNQNRLVALLDALEGDFA